MTRAFRLGRQMKGGWECSITNGAPELIHFRLRETRLSYSDYSALILQYISHASIQPTHVQAFTLLAAFLCSVNCLPQAWILIGQGLRTAQDLGLHVRNFYH